MNINTGLITIIEFVISFGLLIFVHEFGHFIVAKLFKIEVEEFGFGYPPRLLKLFNFQGTDITLNWIPFGGFVRPKGENDPTVAGGLAAANPWKRLGVLSAGSFMNLLTGVLLFAFVFTQIGAPDTRTVEIISVADSSPAAIAGIAGGDRVDTINGERISSMAQLSRIVSENQGEEITITVIRDNQLLNINVTPRLNPPQGEGALGIIMGNPNVKINFFQSLPYGARITYEQGRQLFLLPGRLIQGQINPEEARVVGPKGIYDLYAQARERDQEITTAPGESAAEDIPGINTLWLMAIISVAIGITNLLPIPALDGGRILFLLPEIVLKKRVPPQYENLIHFIGFSALIILMVYITTQDFINPIQLP